MFCYTIVKESHFLILPWSSSRSLQLLGICQAHSCIQVFQKSNFHFEYSNINIGKNYYHSFSMKWQFNIHHLILRKYSLNTYFYENPMTINHSLNYKWYFILKKELIQPAIQTIASDFSRNRFICFSYAITTLSWLV